MFGKIARQIVSDSNYLLLRSEMEATKYTLTIPTKSRSVYGQLCGSASRILIYRGSEGPILR